MKHLQPNVSVIVTTYNRPDALSLVLDALSQQDYPHFEIIVADDGSTNDTVRVIESAIKHSKIHIKHVWHHDNGFQAATIRNRAVVHSTADYLIFLDGDCIPLPSFVRRHHTLAEEDALVAGNRILLSAKFTEKVLRHALPINRWQCHQWLWARLRGQCNHWLPNITLPFHAWRRRSANQWRGAKTCNMAVWKRDFINVNGFDEAYSGWGYEDSDLVIRMIRNGIARKSGRFYVPVLHLAHSFYARDQEQSNKERLTDIQQDTRTRAQRGINQYSL